MEKNLDLYFSVPIPDHIPEPFDIALRLLIRALVNYHNECIDQTVYTKDEMYRIIMTELYNEVESEFRYTEEYLHVNKVMPIFDVEHYIYGENDHFNLFAQHFCQHFTNSIVMSYNNYINNLKLCDYRHTSTQLRWEPSDPTTVVVSIKYY